MNVVLRVDASAKIGMGHLVRSLAVVNELATMRPLTCSLITRSDDIDCEWPIYKIPGSIPEAMEGQWISNQLPHTSVLIADLYHPTQLHVQAMGNKSWLLAFIDDDSPHIFDCEILINPNLSTGMRHNVTHSTKYLSGSKTIILRGQFDNPPPRICSPTMERLLISFGGSDPMGLTAHALRAMQHGGLDSIKRIDVVVGAATQGLDLITSLVNADARCIAMKSVNDMCSLMCRSDAALIGAGTQLYEAAATGLPAATISVNESQRSEAAWMSIQGAIIDLGDCAGVTASTIGDGVRALLEVGVRERMSQRGQQLIDAGGRRRVATAILSAYSGRWL